MKIFLDTNILIDLIANRAGQGAARAVIEGYTGPFDRICVSYLTMANIPYILRKHCSAEQMKSLLIDLSSRLKILPGLDQQFVEVVKMKGPDLEDNLQILCAEYEKCDVILTNNVTHFRGNTIIPVLSPEEFLSRCAKA